MDSPAENYIFISFFWLYEIRLLLERTNNTSSEVHDLPHSLPTKLIVVWVIINRNIECVQLTEKLNWIDFLRGALIVLKDKQYKDKITI